MKISIVIPAKNESGAIVSLLKKIINLDLNCEVILVDDGSTDNTAALAKQCGVKVIRHTYSKGNGAAIKSGARAATGDVLAFLDADGQHDPADIPRLIDKLDEGYDMVVGARDKGSQASAPRLIANWIYNKLASYMTGHKIDDLTSGFRVVRTDKFREFLYLLPNGFSYPTTSTMAFFRAGYSVCYIPIHAAQRIGKSHISIFKDGFRFLLIIFKIGSLYSPLKIFVPLSFMFFCVGLSYYVYTYISFSRFTNMSAMMFTTSILVFLIGLISEQITQLMYRTYDPSQYNQKENNNSAIVDKSNTGGDV